jgi:TfoX/Sxy family transcriptional regulator of competence genes
MSDFAAFLRKSLKAHGDTTPQARQRLYGKARQVLAAKLEAMNPRPDPKVVERQKTALENAIVTVEADFEDKDQLLAQLDDLARAVTDTSRRRRYFRRRLETG